MEDATAGSGAFGFSCAQQTVTIEDRAMTASRLRFELI
jgi:hypothetical protein